MTKPSQSTPQVARDEVSGSHLIEIFRAGTHVDMHGREQTFTREDLVNLAAGYDPATSEAPIVIGHPQTNGPAYGWVRGLKADGDVLSAELHQVDADFAEMVRTGRFKKRSASFFLADGKDNPKPGGLYLRHVGFLGAAAPAVKGLKEVSFAGDEAGTVEFSLGDRRWGFAAAADLFRRLRDHLIDSIGLEKADQVMSPWQIDSLKDAAAPDIDDGRIGFTAPHAPVPDANSAGGDPPAGAAVAGKTKEKDVTQQNADFAARDEDLKKREERIAADEQRVAERQAKERRDDAVSFADGLIAGGKLLPKDKTPVVELLLSLPTDKPLSFASETGAIEKPAADLFRELLTSMPQRLDFSEKSGGAQTVDMSDPNELAKRALEFQATESKAGREISIATAVQHISSSEASR